MTVGLGAFSEMARWDCGHAFSPSDMQPFSKGTPGSPARHVDWEDADAESIADNLMADMAQFQDDWIDQNQDEIAEQKVMGEPAYEEYLRAYRTCAIRAIQARIDEARAERARDMTHWYLESDGVELERFDDIEEALQTLARMPDGELFEGTVDGKAHTSWVVTSDSDELKAGRFPAYRVVANQLFQKRREAARQRGFMKQNPAKHANPMRLGDWAEDDEVYRFQKAMLDPDPSSTQVAQDILLETGVANVLWLVGDDIYWGQRDNNEVPGPQDLLEQRYGTVEGRQMMLVDQGMFRFVFQHDGDEVQNHVIWVLTRRLHRGVDKGYRASFWFRYGLEPNRRQRVTGIQDKYTTEINLGSSVDSNDARGRAARSAWASFAIMKESLADGLSGMQMMQRVIVHGDERQREIPMELNPTMPKTKNPNDVAAARDKYEEFHRYAPKKEIFEKGFVIPARMLKAGRSKWVTYRSAKVDPASLVKPKRPVDYIHEHNAGVCTYIPDPDADTTVPEKFRQVDALTRLGHCLGFCFKDDQGEDIEAEATSPLPDLYCTPDGKCLLVIQDRKKVLAMIWGGGLGVFARGIDG